MNTKMLESKIVPINWVDETERWIIVPGTNKEHNRRRIKEVSFSKNKCYFAAGVPKSIIDFIYRSVKQLDLTNRTLIFSRGTVRSSKGLMKHAVSIYQLDWGVGILITIPRILNYREEITVTIKNTEYSLKLMELVVLHGLLQIAYPHKDEKFYSVKTSLILAKGWRQLYLAK